MQWSNFNNNILKLQILESKNIFLNSKFALIIQNIKSKQIKFLNNFLKAVCCMLQKKKKQKIKQINK